MIYCRCLYFDTSSMPNFQATNGNKSNIYVTWLWAPDPVQTYHSSWIHRSYKYETAYTQYIKIISLGEKYINVGRKSLRLKSNSIPNHSCLSFGPIYDLYRLLTYPLFMLHNNMPYIILRFLSSYAYTDTYMYI